VTRPVVDVVIAVHSSSRPVERAARSVLHGTRSTPVVVTIVCHGLDPAVVEDRLGEAVRDPRVRIVPYADGVRSPAGPFNHGLDLATGEYTSVLGSDDLLEPGAVDSWVRRAREDRADVVIARQRHQDGRPVRTPPVRPWRRSALDGVRDRLSYRSAPLGIVSRERFPGLRFTTGVAVGEDIAYVTALWFGGARVSLDRGPAYVVTDDAVDRTTRAVRPVAEELAYLDVALEACRALTPEQVTAFVTKLLRVHVFGAVHNRQEPAAWDSGARQDLARAADRLLVVAPRAAEPFSLADRRLLADVRDPEAPVEDLLRHARDRRRFGSPSTLVTADPRRLLHREAPVRFMAASVLAGAARPARGAVRGNE